MKYRKLIQQMIDLHIYIGPEIIPRKYDRQSLIDEEKGKIKGLGVKNHFFPTIFSRSLKQNETNPFIIDSVVLNKYAGGFNADIIRASTDLSDMPIIVWFPTLHAEDYLMSQKYEIAEEWIDPALRGGIKLQKSENIEHLTLYGNNNEISNSISEVIQAIDETDSILATGDLSWKDSDALVRYAVKNGVEKMILTHPIYQKINMPIAVQKSLVELGAYVEHCYSMFSIDGIPMKKIASQIKEIGASACIVSSDVGQQLSKSPSESLNAFVEALVLEGIFEKEIETMGVENPTKLLKG